MNNTLSTISKLLMVVVGCLIVYYLMNLAGNSKKLMSDFSQQQEEISQVRELNAKIARLEDKIENLRKGMDSSRGDYVTEKKLSAEFAEQQNSNRENMQELADVIADNRKQMEEYEGVLQKTEEKIAAVTEAVNNLQLNEKSDFSVSYPVKDKFNLENEKKIAELQKILDRVVAVNAALRGELAEVSTRVQSMDSALAVNKVISESQGSKDENAAAAKLAQTFQQSLQNITSASRETFKGLEDKFNAVFKSNKAELAAFKSEVLEEVQKKYSALSNEKKTELAAVRNEVLEEVQKKFSALSNEKKTELAAVRNEVLEEVQKKFSALSNEKKAELAAVRNEVLEEVQKKYSVLSSDKQESAVVLQKNIEEKITSDYEQKLTELKNITVKEYQQVAQGLESDIEVLAEKFNSYKEMSARNWGAFEVKVQNLQQDVAGVVDSRIAGITKQLRAEIEKLDQEYKALVKSLADFQVVKAEAEKKEEPVAGIIVTRTFDRSLVLISTDKGSYVFNPYKDFTGVIRVRDSSSAEKIIRVPYTGDYLKISGSVIDSGPFARNCAQGINCNLEARGSLSGKVEVE